MKIITIGTLKGGTGKTTVTFNLAGKIAEKARILLADADPQSNLSATAGIDITLPEYNSIRNVFTNRKVLPEEVITKAPVPELPNMDIIPSTIKLTETEMRLVNSAAREQLLYNWIDDNREYLDEHYDYMIIDTNPSMGVINQNAFRVADSIILISDVDNDSLQGAELFVYLWDEIREALRMDDNVKALVMNNFNRTTKLSGELQNYYKDNDYFSTRLVPSYIPSAVAFKNTKIEHKPLNILDPKHAANGPINEIINDLYERGIL